MKYWRHNVVTSAAVYHKKTPLNHRLTAPFVRSVTWSFCSALYEALTSAETTYSSLVELVYRMARTPLHCGCSCQVLRVKRQSRDRKRASICQTLKPAIGYSCFLLVCSTFAKKKKKRGREQEQPGRKWGDTYAHVHVFV